MPRVLDASPAESGPGSAFVGTTWGKKRTAGRRRRPSKSRSHSPPASSSKSNEKKKKATEKQFIGQELLEWNNENGASSINTAPVSKTAKKKSGSMSKDPPLTSNQENTTISSRKALALDTRTFFPEGNQTLGPDLCQHFHEFLHTLLSRGATPCVFATTVQAPAAQNKTKKKKKSSPVHIQTMDVPDASALEKILDENASLLSPVGIENDKAKSGDAVPVPKALVAKFSWKLFGEMVNSIVIKDKKKKNNLQSPLEITILSSDISFFCDADAVSHKQAIGSFWDRVVPLFQDLAVSAINIVVSRQPGRLGLALQGSDDDEDTTMIDGDDSSLTAKRRAHELAVTKCIHAIQAEFATRAEADFQISRMAMDGTPVNLSFAIIEHSSVGYKYLSRQWVRNALLGQSLRSRMQLDLPETVDGTQCSVNLDMAYQILPFAADSMECKRLWNDLQFLARSKTEVIQVVPLSSLDASLLFGVPVTVRAGLETDFHRFQEMQVLVRSLFQSLQERELALFLYANPENETTGAQLDSGLFDKSGQTFVLMAQEPPKSAEQAPHSGVLFRYATADQFLTEATTASSSPLLDDETERQYADYVDQSLEYLECKPVNPLFPNLLPTRSTTKKHRSVASLSRTSSGDMVSAQGESKIEPTESSFWDDSAGVGSRGPPATQGDDDDTADKDGDYEQMVESDDDMLAFDYA